MFYNVVSFYCVAKRISYTHTHTHTHIYICVYIYIYIYIYISLGFPGSSDGKESACNGGDLGSISGEGHGNPFQYSFLEKPMDRGAWPATVHGVIKSQT